MRYDIRVVFLIQHFGYKTYDNHHSLNEKFASRVPRTRPSTSYSKSIDCSIENRERPESMLPEKYARSIFDVFGVRGKKWNCLPESVVARRSYVIYKTAIDPDSSTRRRVFVIESRGLTTGVAIFSISLSIITPVLIRYRIRWGGVGLTPIEIRRIYRRWGNIPNIS